jgi:hypothetical protein
MEPIIPLARLFCSQISLEHFLSAKSEIKEELFVFLIEVANEVDMIEPKTF